MSNENLAIAGEHLKEVKRILLNNTFSGPEYGDKIIEDADFTKLCNLLNDATDKVFAHIGSIRSAGTYVMAKSRRGKIHIKLHNEILCNEVRDRSGEHLLHNVYYDEVSEPANTANICSVCLKIFRGSIKKVNAKTTRALPKPPKRKGFEVKSS